MCVCVCVCVCVDDCRLPPHKCGAVRLVLVFQSKFMESSKKTSQACFFSKYFPSRCESNSRRNWEQNSSKPNITEPKLNCNQVNVSFPAVEDGVVFCRLKETWREVFCHVYIPFPLFNLSSLGPDLTRHHDDAPVSLLRGLTSTPVHQRSACDWTLQLIVLI